MTADYRRIGVILAGLCSFLDLYATQSLLPMLAGKFDASPAQVSLTVGATTLAVALIAPFTGIVADVLGRRRVIVIAMFLLVVPTALVGFASSLGGMIFWRFAQGLFLPPIFAVTIAYVAEEWEPFEATAATGIFTSATGFGGFLSRFLTGLIAEHFGWRAAFFALAALTLACALGVVIFLPKEQNFVRSRSVMASSRQMAQHLANPRLIAAFSVGFGILFSFVAIFTYVNFRLAAPPFNLSPAALGSIFIVYLVGVVVTPLTVKSVALIGRRRLVALSIAGWIGGLLLTLSGSLAAILAGLALATGCGFTCQSCSTSYVALTAQQARSSAVGLYVTVYYLGGSIGAAVTGIAWNLAGWSGCVAFVAAVLLLVAGLVLFFWQEPTLRRPQR